MNSFLFGIDNLPPGYIEPEWFTPEEIAALEAEEAAYRAELAKDAEDAERGYAEEQARREALTPEARAAEDAEREAMLESCPF